jgi:hypothetical protein
MLCAVVQLGSPMRAYALFEWLDHLSGPGPFHGIEYQFKLICVMSRPDPKLTVQALRNVVMARGFSTMNLPPETQTRFTPSDLLDLAVQTYAKQREAERRPNRDVDVTAMIDALARVRQSLLEAAVPRVRELPGSIIWGNCRDHPNAAGEEYRRLDPQYPSDPIVVERGMRHPMFSVDLDYGSYTTGHYFLYDSSNSANFAHGKPIDLQFVEIQPSIPLTGRHDFLDAHFGIGWYIFTSDDVPRFGGLILEPIRLDLHAPAQWLDRARHPLTKLAYSLSLRAGLVNFPGGFSATAFNGTGEGARAIAGDEFIPEVGIVIDVGRLFGK